MKIASLVLLACLLIDASQGWSSQATVRSEDASTLKSQGWSSKAAVGSENASTLKSQGWTLSNDVPSATTQSQQGWSSKPIEDSAASTTRSQQGSSQSIMNNGAEWNNQQPDSRSQGWNSAASTQGSSQQPREDSTAPSTTMQQAIDDSPVPTTRSQEWSTQSTEELEDSPASAQEWSSQQRSIASNSTMQSHGWSSKSSESTKNDVASVDITQVGIAPEPGCSAPAPGEAGQQAPRGGVRCTRPVGTRTLFVDQEFGPFRTLQDAVNAVPDNNQQWIVIQVAPGVYKEKVYIPMLKTFIDLRGSGLLNTIVTWADNAGNQTLGKFTGTLGSSTFTVSAARFIARDISFKNEAPPATPGAIGMQAVAAAFLGDMSAMYNCGFYGNQDTLYDYRGRHYYENCYIEGTVDFIFGNAQSIFQRCTMYTKAERFGAISAHRRWTPIEPTGMIFLRCHITGEFSPGFTYLGRPWGPYARTIYLYTRMENVITPKGWNNWRDPNKELTVDYGQYKCTGPGAREFGRVGYSRELRPEEVTPYLNGDFIDAKLWLTNEFQR